MKDAPAPGDDPWQRPGSDACGEARAEAIADDRPRQAQVLRMMREDAALIAPPPPATGNGTGSAHPDPQLDARPLNLAPVADQLTAIAELLRTGRLGALSRIAGFVSESEAHDDPEPRRADDPWDQPPSAIARAYAPPMAQGSWNPELASQRRTALAHPALPAPTPGGDLPALRRRFADLAREAYASRRKRAAIFGSPDLFGEPAWDILLDLYIAHADKKPVSVSSACIGSAAPPTTGLRWLGVLAQHGLVVREHDPDDQRRVLVRLSDRGLEAMDQYFANVVAHRDRRAAFG